MANSFLLHHTSEGRIGLCADCDPNLPPEDAIIARLTFEQTIGLADDIHQTLTDFGHGLQIDHFHEPDED